jgi:hypothetical protein
MARLRLAVLAVALLALTGGALADTYTVVDFFNDIIKPGRRQGLSGRFDIAGGLVHTKAEHSTWTPPEWTSDDGGGGVVMGIGYGVTDRIMISGSIRGLIYGEYAALGVVLGPIGFAFADEHFSSVAGLTYFLRSSYPSWFIEAGAGTGSIGNPFDDALLYKTSAYGPSLYGGIGYEFAKHYQVEVHIHWTQNSGTDQSRKGKWTATSVFATIGVLGY